ncbi:MAG: hypothetical protein JW384_01131 [Nitrosomonadaceae bacterium]|jgi:hypothetical protein|nr:hypothetical protein [Nitrosomonadaceae bacterium]
MFTPGQSGNPSGRPKERVWKDALVRAMKRRDAGAKDGDPLALEKLADAVISAAMMGDMSAVKEIADRLDGKVAQTTILQGDEDGGAVRLTAIERTVVYPPDRLSNLKLINGT